MSEQTAAYTKVSIDEMESIWGGGFKRARASVGATAFGMSVSDLPPNFEHVPPHVHTFDGQEELYMALAGSGWLEINGERVPLDTETAIRVGPTATRKPISGPDGLRMLIVGGIPGKAYEPFPLMEAGAPEPTIPDLPGVQAATEHESSDDHTAMRFDEMTRYDSSSGSVALTAIRPSIGLESFGISMVEMKRDSDLDGYSDYPFHDHAESNQEEVYVITGGAGELRFEDGSIEVEPGDTIRVAPEVKREFIPGDDGLSLIAIGAPIGAPYDPSNRN